MASGLAMPCAGDVGRRAVDGLEQARARRRAEARGGKHPERAGEHRRLVAEDVAEQVLGHDHVEVGGPGDELHRGVVHQHVVELDVRSSPPRRRSTVSRQRREVSSTFALSTEVTLPSPARRAALEGDAGDPLDLLDRVGAVVVGAVAVAAGFAEVDAAGELAHDQQVGALDPLAAQRARVEQRRRCGLTGRRLAYRPRPLRRPSSPCSGRGASGSVVSHLGPPTAQSSTASEARHASSTSSVSAVPCSSIEAPPIGCSVISKSPSSLEQLGRRGADLGSDPVAGQQDDSRLRRPRPRGLDVEADVVERQRLVHLGDHGVGEVDRAGPRAGAPGAGPASTVAHELARARSGVSGLCSSQQLGPRRSPRRSRRSLGLLGLGEVPHHRHALEVRGERLPRRPTLDDRLREPGDVARAAALRDAAARRVAAPRGCAGRGCRGRGPSGRSRWRRRRRPARRSSSSARSMTAISSTAVAEVLARLLDHLLGAVERDHPSRRAAASSSSAVTRPEPQPASSTVSSPPARAARAPPSPTRTAGRRRGRRSRRPTRGRRCSSPTALTARS